MVYLIFTAEGLADVIEDILASGAACWLNPPLMSSTHASRLAEAGIELHALPETVVAGNDKAMLAAFEHVESQSGAAGDILVEYL